MAIRHLELLMVDSSPVTSFRSSCEMLRTHTAPPRVPRTRLSPSAKYLSRVRPLQIRQRPRIPCPSTHLQDRSRWLNELHRRCLSLALRAQVFPAEVSRPLSPRGPVVSSHAKSERCRAALQRPSDREYVNAATAAQIRRGCASSVRRASPPPRSGLFHFVPPPAGRFHRRPAQWPFRAPTRTGQTSQWPKAIQRERARPESAAARPERIAPRLVPRSLSAQATRALRH